MKLLLTKLAFLFFTIFVLSLGLDALYRRPHHFAYNWPSGILPNPPLAEPYQIVKVGNSHAEDGITFEGYNLKSLDLAGVAQRFRFDLALLQQYKNQIDDSAVILIEVSPISFSHRKADRNDGLQGNYYGTLSPFLIPDLVWSNYLQSEIVPSLRAGYMLRQDYRDEVRERIAKEEKWVEPASTSSATTTPLFDSKPQPAVDPRAFSFLNVQRIQDELAHHSPVSQGSYSDNIDYLFNKWYHTEEFDPKYFAMNRKDLEKLIAYCQQQGWRPVLVTVPLSDALVEALLDDYEQKYLYDNLAKTDTRGVEYLDFSNHHELTSDLYLYSNSDHLSDDGARVLSYLLLQELIAKGYVSKDVDGYYYAQK